MIYNTVKFDVTQVFGQESTFIELSFVTNELMFVFDRQISSSQWKKFIEAGRLPSSERFQTDLWKGDSHPRERSRSQHEPPKKNGEAKKLNTSGIRKPESSSIPARGVPASFGYVKKSSGTASTMTMDAKRHDALNGYKTANVTPVAKLIADAGSNRSLERPKTRLKVSGGTQTDPAGSTWKNVLPQQRLPVASSVPCGSYSDSEYQANVKYTIERPGSVNGSNGCKGNGASGSSVTFKSYSLTGPVANQLSSNIRERLMLTGTHSLPKSHPFNLKGAFISSLQRISFHCSSIPST